MKKKNLFFEPQKGKVQESFRELKDRKRAFNHELHILQSRREEALRAGDKETAKKLKDGIESLGRRWQHEQHVLHRRIQEDRRAHHG